MKIDIVTIFPSYLAPLSESLVGKAQARGLLDIAVHDLRTWTSDVHRTVDDSPYGGGPGMLMRPEPWWAALSEIAPPGQGRPLLVVPTPSGRRFSQQLAQVYAAEEWLIVACARYEGFDARLVQAAAERMPVDEVSLGDYVLAGGEAAALVIVEAVTRLLPGVVGNAASVADDSFATGLLEGPSYTRPEVWDGRPVPAVLRSGDHARIARWRRDEALRRTAQRRPDLLADLPAGTLDDRDRAVLADAGFTFGHDDVAPLGS